MIIIADSGPLLHLFWVDALEWALPPQEIVVVEAVWREVEQYAPDALSNSRLRRFSESMPVPLALKARRLDSGEEAALAYALAQSDKTDLVLLCDGQKARKACQAFFADYRNTGYDCRRCSSGTDDSRNCDCRLE